MTGDEVVCERCHRDYSHVHCTHCARAFIPAGSPPPGICGAPACRAWQHWGPQDWAGRARMATARAAAGVPLDDLDHEALRRLAAEADTT